MPGSPFSLEEQARGAEVRELPEPLPVHAWFQLSDRLIRRSDSQAYRLTRDAVWVEASRGETKLAAWVWLSWVKHRRQVGPWAALIAWSSSVGQVVAKVVAGVGEELQPVPRLLQ